MNPRITVVGDALLDVLVHPSGPMRAGADVPAAIQVATGGQGANLAVRLARRGARPRLVCALGDDAGGEQVRRALEDEGVEVLGLPAETTGTVVALLGADGDRTMLSQRAPFASRASAALPVGDAGWLVLSGYLLTEPGADAFAVELARHDRPRALVGCAVPDAALAAWVAAAQAFAPDLVVLNRDEAERAALDERAGIVVTTGSDRVTAVIDGSPVVIDVPPGPPAVDTTGAGDAFAAALLAALPGPWPPSETALRAAMSAATVAAGETARVVGAQTRIPSEPAARLGR